MRSKAVISRSYSHLSNFFFNKLGIAQAPPFALVDELRMIVAQYRGGPVPPEGWKHVAEILADISDATQKMPSIPGSFKVLAGIAAFPVRVPAEGIALRPIDEFYVPDRASKYANVFRERVALLELPDSVPMTRIRPLLESDILKDRIRYLDPHVTKRSLPQGKQVLDPDATGLYSSRVEYMARYVLLGAVAAAADRDGVILVQFRELDSSSTIATSQTSPSKPSYLPSFTRSTLLKSSRSPQLYHLTHAERRHPKTLRSRRLTTSSPCSSVVQVARAS